MPSKNLSWTKAQPGSIQISGQTSSPPSNDHNVWYRHASLVEFSSSNDNKIITSLHLSLPTSHKRPLLNVVRAAVRKLRFDHPGIASKHGWTSEPHTHDNFAFVYEEPRSESDIDKWLDEVVLDRTDVLSSAGGNLEKAIEMLTYELGKPAIGFSGAPLFIVHYIPPAAGKDGQHGLVFFCDHSLFDAVGAFQIMDLCISRIASVLAAKGEKDSLPWGEETSRLSPAIIESARIPHTTEKTPEDEEMLEKIKRQGKTLPDAHKLPIPHPNSHPSATGLIVRTLRSETLTKLRDTARTHGCTIFTVLFAALSLASVRLSPPSKDTLKQLTVPFPYSPYNIRPLACDDPNDKSQWAVRLSLGFNSYVAYDVGRFSRLPDDARQLAEDVWTLGKEVREQINDQKKHADRTAVWIDDVWNLLFEAVVGSLGDLSVKPTSWYPVLSSIGVMDNYLTRSYPIASGGEILVSSPRLSPVFHTEAGESCLALHAFTWGGELNLAFTFPESAMGSAEEQKDALKDSRDGDAVGLRYIDEVMHILDVSSR